MPAVDHAQLAGTRGRVRRRGQVLAVEAVGQDAADAVKAHHLQKALRRGAQHIRFAPEHAQIAGLFSLLPGERRAHLVPKIRDPPAGQPAPLGLAGDLMHAPGRVGGKHHVVRAGQPIQRDHGAAAEAAVRLPAQPAVGRVLHGMQRACARGGRGRLRFGRPRCGGRCSRAGAPVPEGVPLPDDMHLLQGRQVARKGGVPAVVHAGAAQHGDLMAHAAQIFGQLGGPDRPHGILRGEEIADDQDALTHERALLSVYFRPAWETVWAAARRCNSPRPSGAWPPGAWPRPPRGAGPRSGSAPPARLPRPFPGHRGSPRPA